jgi:large subunit ribosomal protein L9
MKVILLESVTNLGNPGDLVNVKDGYATNFLIPKKMALSADDKNVKAINHKKKILEHKMAREKKVAEKSVSVIEALSCTISRKAGEEEKLFGSVTSKDIEEYLRNEGLKIDKKDIVLPEPIKALGIYNVAVKLCPGVEAKLKVWVVPEDKKE